MATATTAQKGIQTALLDAERLHLQHGPIDLIVSIDAEPAARRQLWHRAGQRFQTILTELVDELSLLRTPVLELGPNPVSGDVARLMVNSVAALASYSFVTPMAAVAGAVAQTMLTDLLEESVEIRRASVNNGGDIALFLNRGECLTIACVSNPISGAVAATLRIEPRHGIAGIATSGWRGRSHSLGIADAVTVLAADAASADVAATLIANAVNIDSPAVRRCAATELNPDSDLGQQLVTIDVAQLSGPEIDRALQSGFELASAMLESGDIIAAMLCLQGGVASVGQLPLALTGR